MRIVQSLVTALQHRVTTKTLINFFIIKCHEYNKSTKIYLSMENRISSILHLLKKMHNNIVKCLPKERNLSYS